MVDGVLSFSSGTVFSAGSGIGSPPEDFKKKLTALGIPESVVAQGKEAVKSYAEQNGISLPEPPAKPDKSKDASLFAQSQSADKEPPAELKQQLIALGIPESTISQGREAVMQYAQENGISLPKPPTPPGVGANLDFNA